MEKSGGVWGRCSIACLGVRACAVCVRGWWWNNPIVYFSRWLTQHCADTVSGLQKVSDRCRGRLHGYGMVTSGRVVRVASGEMVQGVGVT